MISAFGVQHVEPVAKYQRGTITQHQEQANLHSRKKQSGKRQAALGSAAAGAGLTLGLSGQSAGHNKAGAVLAVGGAGLAGVGATRAVYHGHRQNQHVKAAQQARKQRNASLVKSDRDRRLASAGLAAGSGGAAVSSGRALRASRSAAAESVADRDIARRAFGVADQRIARHATKGKGTLPPTQNNVTTTRRILTTGVRRDSSAEKLARASFRSARQAKGGAAGAVLLGGAAVATAHRRKPTPQRSYSYR